MSRYINNSIKGTVRYFDM